MKTLVHSISNLISARLKDTLSSESKEFDWNRTIRKDKKIWQSHVKANQNGPKILIATSTGGHPAVTPIESLLAVALTLRGAQVHFLLCDKALPACLMATYDTFSNPNEFPHFGPQKSLCDDCFQKGIEIYKPLGLPIHLYSQWITKSEEKKIYNIVKNIQFDRIKEYTYEGLAIGEHALAGALRYYARASLDDEQQKEIVLKRYFHAALITKIVIKRLVKKYQYSCAVFHHGIYIPQGIIGEICRKLNVRVVNWTVAYRKNCFIFSHKNTYHHTLMTEPVIKWENIKLTPRKDTDIMTYLKSRWYGTKDWIWFHEKPVFDFNKIVREFKIHKEKPLIGLLTNVMWDAQLHYPANAFPNMLDWVIKTIHYFIKKPNLQLIIRVHPAEIRGTIPSRQRIVDEIHKFFPQLPNNIIVIPPENSISTYTIMSKCNTVLIYGTKTGVELTSFGIPVIVAGEAWIRNKGITMDVKTEEEYIKLLEKLPLKKGMSKHMIERARKYAYHFFFQRMIPLTSLTPTKGWPPYTINIKNLKELNNDQGLKVITDGIIRGTDFIYKTKGYDL